MKRIYSDTENSLLLSLSPIGSIRKCKCCDSYQLCLGNVAIRLSHSDILMLTEMLVQALEANALYGQCAKEKRENA